MNLNDRAMRSRDQLVLNRVAAACVSVAIGMRGGKKVIADGGQGLAQRMTPVLLATLDDDWLQDDGALMDGVRALWGKV